jgi:NADPH:quinone reductase-like Zn-dependent oxidoreductase
LSYTSGMKAIRVHQHGDYDVLKIEDIPQPEPGPGKVRIQVAWAAMNHLDTWVRRGVPGHKFPLPMTPGCDFSGVVEALGAGVAGWKIGDRVAVAPGHSCGQCRRCGEGKQNLCHRYGIYGETEDGGNAEFAVVDAENLMAVPDDVGLDVAAAFPLAYLTAWHMLTTRCGVQPGDKVLIHAAGSGVSAAATQIAKLHGARVFVTAGSDEKVERGIQNGAEDGVNYRESDWVPAVKKWAGRGGLDIIVDHVGVDTLPKGLWLLARGGRIVTCGVTSGAQMELNMAPLFFKTLSVLGSTMGGLGEQKQVADLVFSGSLDPIIDSRFELEDIASAHRRMGKREVFGKILLQVNPGLA